MNMNPQISQPSRPLGMSDLRKVQLNVVSQGMLEAARRGGSGPAHVQRRLLAEAQDLLAQGQLSRRFRVVYLDLSTELRALVDMIAPVPCRPDPNGPLQIFPMARFGLRYPPSVFNTALPGTSLVEIVAPPAVFHSNVRFGFPQVVCLGPVIPIGFPVHEIMLLLYNAMTLKTMSLDERDPVGILNREAVDFFLRNPRFVPLTVESFIRPGV
jgi:hypothetical protein